MMATMTTNWQTLADALEEDWAVVSEGLECTVNGVKMRIDADGGRVVAAPSRKMRQRGELIVRQPACAAIALAAGLINEAMAVADTYAVVDVDAFAAAVANGDADAAMACIDLD